MRRFVFTAQSEADTDRLAAAIERALDNGAVVELDGTLGAGKTRLVQGIARAAGVDPREVVSPTFTLVHEYRGRREIYHFDAYRIVSDEEFMDLGADEYFSRGGIALVEWGERVAGCLPPDRLVIRIQVAGEMSRSFEIEALGANSEAALAKLARLLAS